MDAGQTSRVTPRSTTSREHARVLDRPDAVPDPVGAEVLEAGAHAGRPEQLAAVRDGRQTGVPGDPEGPGEVLRSAAALVVGQPEADDAAAGVLRGEPGEGAGVQRVPGPVGADDHPDADARRGARRQRPRRGRARGTPSARRSGRRSRSGRPGSPASPDPSAASSSATSRSSRRTSAGVRMTSRAWSYSRWNRNQPRSSVADEPLGRRVQQGVGQPDPVLPARGRASSACRIAPVKCRCRWALGSGSLARRRDVSWAGAVGRSVLSPSPRRSSFCSRDTPSTRSSSPRA